MPGLFVSTCAFASAKLRSCILTYGINVGHVEILYVLAKYLQKLE